MLDFVMMMTRMKNYDDKFCVCGLMGEVGLIDVVSPPSIVEQPSSLYPFHYLLEVRPPETAPLSLKSNRLLYPFTIPHSVSPWNSPVKPEIKDMTSLPFSLSPILSYHRGLKLEKY